MYFYNRLFDNHPYIFSFVLGIFIGAGFEPINFLIGPFIGLGLFFHFILVKGSGRRYQPKKVFLLGWLLGLGYFITGLYWTACALHVQIDQYWPLIPLAVVGIPAICALIPALASWITYRSNFHKHSLKLICFSIIWITLEWVRGHYIVGGFPWLLIGDIWIAYLPFAQLFSIFGNYGLSLITLIIILILPASRNWITLLGITLTLLVWFWWGTVRLESKTSFNHNFNVAVIQPNIKQINKWNPDLIRRNVDQLVQATKINRIDTMPTLFILPEAAITYRLNTEENLCRYITQYLEVNDYLITGGTRISRTPNINLYNALFVLNHYGQILNHYDKVHLTPFGEYIPLHQIFPKFIQNIVGNQIDFSFGQTNDSIEINNITTFLPLICYEGIFHDEISQAKKVNWIVNITNDGWFLNSSGPYQHFAMIRSCAIAWGIPIVRVANTGISGIIDGYGRVISKLNYGEGGTIISRVPTKLTSPTFFAIQGHFLFWTLYGMLIIIFEFIILKDGYKRRRLSKL